MKRICCICGNEYEDLTSGSGEYNIGYCCDICDIRKFDTASHMVGEILDEKAETKPVEIIIP